VSSELAIATVTRTLRRILEKEVKQKMGLANNDVIQNFHVTTLPPHKVRDTFKAENIVNLFLYRTEINAAWRNHPLPSQTKPGENGPAPLALNLEYLISAYGEGEQEDISHYYLGAAMRVLNDCAIVPRKRLEQELEGLGRVHEQIENVRVAPRALSIEEMSKLWSIFQTQYRVSASYLVTVLLIDSKSPVASAPPVLKRGPDDKGITTTTLPPPAIDSIRATTGFTAARLGEQITIKGENLDGSNVQARLHHPLRAAIDLPATVVDATKVTVTLPDPVPASNVSADWPAGLYSLALVVDRPDLPQWITNEVPFVLAPSITVAPTVMHTPNATFTVTIEATPQVRPSQTVLVIWDGTQIHPKTFVQGASPDDPSTITFDVKPPAGLHRVRLRVDGADSIPVIKVGSAWEFDPAQSVDV
jgi:hypothetical protein